MSLSVRGAVQSGSSTWALVGCCVCCCGAGRQRGPLPHAVRPLHCRASRPADVEVSPTPRTNTLTTDHSHPPSPPRPGAPLPLICPLGDCATTDANARCAATRRLSIGHTTESAAILICTLSLWCLSLGAFLDQERNEQREVRAVTNAMKVPDAASCRLAPRPRCPPRALRRATPRGTHAACRHGWGAFGAALWLQKIVLDVCACFMRRALVRSTSHSWTRSDDDESSARERRSWPCL